MIQKVENLNSIALLTFHINYYLSGILNVFKGGDLEIRDQFSFDLKDLKSEEEWNTLVNDFLNNSEMFVKHIEGMSESILDDFFLLVAISWSILKIKIKLIASAATAANSCTA